MGLRNMTRSLFGASDRDIELFTLIQHNQHLGSIERALAQGAKANARDTRAEMAGGVSGFNRTPLHYAAYWKGGTETATKLDLVKALLKAGADPNAAEKDGSTPLHLFAHDVNFAELLLDHGAMVNVFNVWGETPLHYTRGSLRAAELLISHGADVNAQTSGGDSRGHTPLHTAISSESIPVIKLLLAAGADTTLENSHRLTPIAHARSELMLVQHTDLKAAMWTEEEHAQKVATYERIIKLLETADA